MTTRFLKPSVFIAISLALIVSLVPIIGSTAAPALDPGNPPIPEFAKDIRVAAGLREISGSKEYKLAPVLIEAAANDDGSYRLTYEVGVPTALLQDGSLEEQISISV